MTKGLWLKKVWNGRSKGLSTIIGTVFLTLVIFAISTNVFIWTLSQNAQYTETVKDENQKNIDRQSEYLIASSANYSVLGDEVTVKVTLRNAGSVAAQIINLWVFDTTEQKYTNKSLNLNLNPGEALPLMGPSSLKVNLPGANASHEFASYFVTARGNTVPLTSTEDIIVAQLAQGIGSIAMDFPLFRYYEVQPGDKLGPAQYSFTIPGRKNTVLGAYLTNLDSSRQDINLTEYSCVWLIIPSSSTTNYWPIAKVENETLVPFDYQILEWGKPTLVYFGPQRPDNLKNNICAVNILLYGTIGDRDYGQNIPFVSVYIEG